MTSNAGTTLKANAFGFGAEGYVALESRVHTVLKEMFRPEFLNRVDEIIVFSELSKDEIRRIVDLMLAEVRTQLQEKGLQLVVTEAAKDYLAEKGYDPKYGPGRCAKPSSALVETRWPIWFSAVRENGERRFRRPEGWRHPHRLDLIRTVHRRGSPAPRRFFQSGP